MQNRRETFAEIVKATRERLGLSQTAFGARLDVKQAAVSAWETGDAHPTSLALKGFAVLSGIPFNDLLVIVATEKAEKEVGRFAPEADAVEAVAG